VLKLSVNAIDKKKKKRVSLISGEKRERKEETKHTAASACVKFAFAFPPTIKRREFLP